MQREIGKPIRVKLTLEQIKNIALHWGESVTLVDVATEMGEVEMECPDCGGEGRKARPQSEDPKLKALNHFPLICDRCSGSGEVPAAKPKTEGQAVTPVSLAECP